MKEPLNPIGTCFDSAAIQLMSGEANNPDGTVLVHGIITANLPGQEGWTIGHAWLEFESKHQGTCCIDTTWGVIQSKETYYEGCRPTYIVKYTKSELLELWAKHDYPGPYDEKILAVTNRADQRRRETKNE
jgi:hypothetical protein